MIDVPKIIEEGRDGTLYRRGWDNLRELAEVLREAADFAEAARVEAASRDAAAEDGDA